jgi:DNA-binding transcriptional regulator YiaG
MTDHTPWLTAIYLLENLGELVAAKRQRLGLTSRQMATATHVSYGTIRRLESGLGIQTGNAVKLLRWLSEERPPP